jgi:xanthine dehydrogenase small subunit
MRDYLHLFVNGKEHKISGSEAFQPLSTFLRWGLGATGTKIVCEEGDCGACSVLVGKLKDGKIDYQPINSCIQLLYQADLSHIITVEGLKQNGHLNPVQEAMVECHGTQCGFCTPGFVVAMCEYFDRSKSPCAQGIKDSVTGNLCRCTGYEPIIKAGLNVDMAGIVPLSELYPPAEMGKIFVKERSESVLIKTEDKTVFLPANLADAAKFKSEHSDAIIIAGGTDVCVVMNKRAYAPKVVMSFGNIEGLNEISVSENHIKVGATATLSQLEAFVKDRVPEFFHLFWVFGSPQIRNAGTLAGNIANASPIADTPPFLFVMDAVINLTSSKGNRQVRINDFYKGYKKFDMQADEFISSVEIPLPAKGEMVRLYKVSRRKHLDISTNTAAFKFKLNGNKIEDITIAYGGVAAVILRLPKTEAFLKGKQIELDVFHQAAELAVSEITPISDVRGSKEFRLQLAKNLLSKLFYEIKEGRIAACQQ